MTSHSSTPEPEALPTPPPVAGDALPRSVKAVLSILLFAAFVMLLNETTLSVALPAMMADYSISAATAQWLLTGFMLTLAVVMPTTGWMLERFRTRSVFVFAVVAFLLGTIVAALAPSFSILLFARVLQAVGTAIVMPLLMTVTMTLVPFHKRGTVMGIVSVVMAVGPALGPSLAGVILSFTSWHGIFWFMVPLMVLSGIIGATKLTNVGQQRKAHLDLLSVFLSVIAFGGLVYGLSSVGVIINGDDGAWIAMSIFVVGAIGLGLFVWRQIVLDRTQRALLNLQPLTVANFTLSLLVLIVLFAAMLGALNTLPLYLQGSLLVSALVSGLALLPGGLLEGILSPFFGRIYDRYGPRPLIIPGMIIVTGGIFWLATVDAHTSVWLVVAIHVVFSIGLAGLFSPLMTTALSSLPSKLYGHGSAILNTLQQLAGAAGTAVMLTIFSNISADAQSRGIPEPVAIADGANSAFLATGFLSLVALVLSMFIKPVSLPSTSPATNE
jgi:DHA2 family lincomycin resistance protein-like MFS transporter